MKKIMLTTLCMLSLTSFAQEVNKKSLDSLFTHLNQQKIGAGSVSIFKNGKEVYANSFGNRDYENNLANNTETKFRIGSISKTFTATLILKLIEEKKLSLDTKLSKFYPKVLNSDKITIKDLLQHTSGIHNITDDVDYDSWLSTDYTKQELLSKIYNLKSDFDPSTEEGYSNPNYILLSFIIEDVTKKSYKDALQKYITTPLGLKNTKVGGKILDQKNEAKSYQYINNNYVLQPETSMTIPLGAGFIVSTSSDLNKFMYSLLSGKILKESTLQLMKKIKETAGLGLFKDTADNSIGFGHTGGIDGFSSYSFCFDNNEFCYSFIKNVDEYSSSDLKKNLFNATHSKNISIPTKSTSFAVSNEVLKQYTNDYSSVEIPVTVKFFIENNNLMAQATGQRAFPLSAISNTEFEFDAAKIKIVFEENGNKMNLIQNGKTFNFNKN